MFIMSASLSGYYDNHWVGTTDDELVVPLGTATASFWVALSIITGRYHFWYTGKCFGLSFVQ